MTANRAQVPAEHGALQHQRADHGDEQEHQAAGRQVEHEPALQPAPRLGAGGIGADVVFECAGGSPKQGLAGSASIGTALDSARSGGKIVGVSWFGAPVEFPIDLFRERSLRYVFPDISTRAHLEYTVRLVASGRVNVKPTITHVLNGIDKVPEAFEITANKGKHKAINPAQVVMR